MANTRSATGIPNARLITWWVIASEIVIFGDFFPFTSCIAWGIRNGERPHRIPTPGPAPSTLSFCSRQVYAPCWHTKPPTLTTASVRQN